MFKFLLFTLLICILLPSKIFSFSTNENSVTKEDSIEKISRLRIIPFPNFGYAPETRFYTGAVALFTKRLSTGLDTITRISNFKIEVNYTQNKQLIIGSNWSFFTSGNGYFIPGEISYNKFPENFWGIGNNTLEDAEQLFDSRRIEFNSGLLKRIKGNLFFGPRYQMQYIYGIKAIDEGELGKGSVPGETGGLSSGLGYIVNFDQRQNLLNPQQGHFLSFANTFFGSAFGSDYHFTKFELDAREYIPLFENKKNNKNNYILAFQFHAIAHSGQPPFRMMALLGSEYEMRGYYRGRFRDRQLISFQGEYRFPVIWRIGLAAFAGAGEVANKISDFSLAGLKPTYGGGLRFLVDRKGNVNLRFDYAMGNSNQEFYVSFGEAF
jgi:hypothetical protein